MGLPAGAQIAGVLDGEDLIPMISDEALQELFSSGEQLQQWVRDDGDVTVDYEAAVVLGLDFTI